jgi:serine/threonine-protein kinase
MTELPLASERTPVRLGRYEIVHKLGVGGMADVFLAHQPGPFSTSKLIVIKQLRSGVMDDEQIVKMFADESRIAVRLNHPNVVHTYDAVADGRDFYLVLEFLDGKSLFQVLRVARERMPLALHLWIISQVLAGLHYAHELKEFDGRSMGIVHRDVSPSNVFVTYNGEVKLLDFGIAKSIGASSATREGIVKGKLGYASPEQCLCREVDRRTDLFAVGVMLWEAIAGRRRPLGETDASTYQARIQGSELPIAQAVPHAPPALIDICNRALAHEPDARYQTALEFRQAIDRYLKSSRGEGGCEILQKFMREHFSADIDAMHKRIDEYMGRSRAQGTSRYAALQPTSMSSLPSATPQESADVAGSEPVLPATTGRRIPRQLVISFGGAIALGLLAWLVGSHASRAGAGTPTLATPATMPSEASSSGASSAPAGSANTITVGVSTRPAGAELRLDGHLIANPYQAVHARDSAMHHLGATLSGYESSERELSFETDAVVAIALKPLPQTSAVKAKFGQRRTLAPVASAKQTISTRPTIQADVPQPGDALPKGRKAQKIDETDPY